MATETPNFGLHLFPADDTQTTVKTWRAQIAGDEETSNMMKIDKALKEIKDDQTPSAEVEEHLNDTTKHLTAEEHEKLTQISSVAEQASNLVIWAEGASSELLPLAGDCHVPAGGTAGQVLSKKTGSDYDLQWVTVAGGGGDGNGSVADQDVQNAVNAHNTSSDAHADIRQAVQTAATDAATALNTHTQDMVSHVTATERDAWNAKADDATVQAAAAEAASALTAHTQDTVSHVTAAERATWNAKPNADSVMAAVPVTTADNGKFLRVVDGQWCAVAISNANGVNF